MLSRKTREWIGKLMMAESDRENDDAPDIKNDRGKPIFSCMDSEGLLDLGRVSAYGAMIHGTDNWRTAESKEGARRFWDAAMRHLLAAKKEMDDESGLPHLAHAAWNCLAALWYARQL
jgi:hypothetical protein